MEYTLEELEKILPPYLMHDIKEVEKYKYDNTCHHFDCLLDELYGSINSAQWGNEIPIPLASFIRDKYYYGNLDKLGGRT